MLDTTLRRLRQTWSVATVWRGRAGPEVPAPSPSPDLPAVDLAIAVELAGLRDGRPGYFLALHGGTVIGSGRTPRAAIRAARRTTPGVIPVLVLVST